MAKRLQEAASKGRTITLKVLSHARSMLIYFRIYYPLALFGVIDVVVPSSVSNMFLGTHYLQYHITILSYSGSWSAILYSGEAAKGR